jgi:hypothetical protein
MLNIYRIREKVIKVPWPHEAMVDQLSPRFITVARCSGGCSQVRKRGFQSKDDMLFTSSKD